ncbi:hypothetical protein ASAP_3185 [Asaia bogorensis]|uniref:Uncharacterized protein n=1 Tax=Asaia bogorensis TaxID=91915 RepID=A0A060QJU8_9PROT|nr:hypothetical protein ASAP_3185 [Asaia bogorensis]
MVLPVAKPSTGDAQEVITEAISAAASRMAELDSGIIIRRMDGHDPVL